MDNITKELTLEEVAKQTLQCKLDVWKEIESIKDKLVDGEVRMEDIEAILTKHEAQRRANTDEIKAEFKSLKNEFKQYRENFTNHDENEIKKYDQIIEALENLTEQLVKTRKETDENTHQLGEQRRQSDIDKAVQEALDAEHEPYREYKKKAINVAIGAITLALLGAMWKLTLFVINLDNLLTGTAK